MCVAFAVEVARWLPPLSVVLYDGSLRVVVNLGQREGLPELALVLPLKRRMALIELISQIGLTGFLRLLIVFFFPVYLSKYSKYLLF